MWSAPPLGAATSPRFPSPEPLTPASMQASVPTAFGPKRWFGGLPPGRAALALALGLGAWTVVGGDSGSAYASEAGGGRHAGSAMRFLMAMAVVLMAANLGGALFKRLRQPAVLGELIFGIALGNVTLFGFDIFESLTAEPFLAIAAELGVILLLFQVGLECDLDGLLAVGSSAVTVAVLGVLAPVSLGYGVSTLFLPDGTAWYVHLFTGATLAATSVGITARVLRDIGKLEVPESRVILGAAVVDDVLGLILLAFVLGLIRSADSGGALEVSLVPILAIMGKAVGFLAGAVLLGRGLLAPLVKRLRATRSQSRAIAHSLAYCFTMAAVAEYIGLAAIVGAFAAGVVVRDSIARSFGARQEQYRIDDSITPVSALFVPVFFVCMGMQVDLASFASLDVLLFASALSVAAVASKQVCALGVRGKGLNRWAIGIGMIPRGEVGLIFAGFGSAATVAGSPVFDSGTFSAIVFMVMLTTLATPPLLKAALAKPVGAPAPAGSEPAVQAVLPGPEKSVQAASRGL